MGYLWFSIRLWLRERPEQIARWVAYRLPRKVAYFAFIRVWSAGAGHFAPAADVVRVCSNWEAANVD